MDKKIQITKLEELIESRLAMQSTQRNLLAYGIITPTLTYIKSNDFAAKFETLSEFQKRNLLHLIAGPFNWRNAQSLIVNYKS
jgi:hypothetical protein